MSALDFSHFKKTAQDKKIATLMHPDGHSIKIALANLKPDLKKKLEAMPLHQAEGSEEPVVPLDDASPAEADVPEAVEQGAVQEVQAAPPTAPMAPAVAPVVQAPAAAPALEAQAPAEQPEQAQESVDQTPDQIAAERTQHDILLAHDLQSGHIKPETYGSLFAKKDTLGKIGTLFGLLVSGAGAGLTHTPNAVMAMMDHQIQNDLEAQKADQSNKQNMVKLAIDHTRNQFDNALTNSEVAKNWTENAKQKFLNENMGIVEGIGYYQADNTASMIGIQDQQNAVNKMPPGPQRDKAQADINNTLIPAVFKKMQDNNQKAGVLQHELMGKAKANVGNVKSNPPPKGTATPGVKYDVVDQGKLEEGLSKGRKFGADANKVAGAIPVNSEGINPAVNKEIEELTVNRNNLADADDSFNQLAKLRHAGQIPAAGLVGAGTSLAGGAIGSLLGPFGVAGGAGLGHMVGAKAGESLKDYYERNRGIQVEALKARLGGGMSDADKDALAHSLLPAWNDTDESRVEAHRKMVQHFESNPAESAPTLVHFGLKHPMPKYTFKMPKSETGKENAPVKEASPEKKPEKEMNAAEKVLDVLGRFGRGK